jgi:ABC-type transporter Mla MlaB component
MLRISKPESDESTVTLRLEGQIVGPWVEELRRSSEKLLGNGHRLTLDLTEVTFADHAGVALLRHLQEKVISLTGCSPFLEEQLKKLV